MSLRNLRFENIYADIALCVAMSFITVFVWFASAGFSYWSCTKIFNLYKKYVARQRK